MPRRSAEERRQLLAAQLEEDTLIARALPLTKPSDADLVNGARLLFRYPSCEERQFGSECRKVVLSRLGSWGMELSDLFRYTRELWAGGYRPEFQHEAYGSGNDVEG